MSYVMTMMRQRWIPSLFFLGFFIVIAVNAVLIVSATRTFSGLVVEHPYKKGVEYTRMQAELTAQRALHWDYRLVSRQAEDGRVDLALVWSDAAGKPLRSLDVSIELSRPVENQTAQSLRLSEAVPGEYRGSIMLPRNGLWDIRFLARRGDDSFIGAERLTVR